MRNFLHHPAARQQHEAALGLRVFDDFQLNAMLGRGLFRGFPRVTLIDIRQLHMVSGDLLHLCGQPFHLRSILLISGGDVQGQQMAQRIHGRMHLRAFALFAPS